MKYFKFLPALGVCGMFLASHAANAQTYTIEDLGTFSGADFSTALAVNEFGQTTGWSGSSANTPGSVPGEAFLHTGGKMINLGTFGGTGSIGYGISSALQKDPRDWSDDKGVLVTGWANNAQQVTHAFLYKDHLLRDLGTLPGGTMSTGYAVNPSGDVAGIADEASGYVQAVLFRHGNFISLGTLGGCCGGIATAINREGDVTGNTDVANGDAHAFLYHNGKMTDLGVLPGGNYSSGTGVNDSLEVAGTSGQLDGPNLHSFLWSKGKMTDLGLLPNGVNTLASAINSWGEIVGTAATVTGQGQPFGPPPPAIAHAFLYRKGVLHDLNTMVPTNSGWALQSASGINDRGEISGTGIINNETHGFLLRLDCSRKDNKDCDECRLGNR